VENARKKSGEAVLMNIVSLGVKVEGPQHDEREKRKRLNRNDPREPMEGGRKAKKAKNPKTWVKSSKVSHDRRSSQKAQDRSV